MDDETESPIDDLEASEDLEDDELGDAASKKGGGVMGAPGEDFGRQSAC